MVGVVKGVDIFLIFVDKMKLDVIFLILFIMFILLMVDNGKYYNFVIFIYVYMVIVCFIFFNLYEWYIE